jgi:hypothetical protein
MAAFRDPMVIFCLGLIAVGLVLLAVYPGMMLNPMFVGIGGVLGRLSRLAD